MAGRMVRSCVQTAVKAANYVLGLAGMAVILYALWMLRAWCREVADLHLRQPVPWNERLEALAYYNTKKETAQPRRKKESTRDATGTACLERGNGSLGAGDEE